MNKLKTRIIIFIIITPILIWTIFFIYNYYVLETHSKFDNLTQAEAEIGEIETPDMPEGYNIKKITFDDDGFTHFVTRVIYEKEDKDITFMIASSWFSSSPAEVIDSKIINDITWITNEDNFVLKWRNSNQESYKYFFTKNEKDKQWLFALAEKY